MTTKELARKLELDVKKLEVREKCTDDPCDKIPIRKKRIARENLLKAVRNASGNNPEKATVDLDSVECR